MQGASLVGPGQTKRPAVSQKISTRLQPKKCSDPFASRGTRYLTAFSEQHSTGNIPVHIHHTGNRMLVQWDTPPQQLPCDRLLLLSAEGLRETSHPYVLLAPKIFEQICGLDGAGEALVRPLHERLLTLIRQALMDPESFDRGLDALCLVSDLIGADLNRHLPQLLTSLAKRASSKQYRERIENALVRFETNGGAEASRAIKQKVPTHTPLYKVEIRKPEPKRAAFS